MSEALWRDGPWELLLDLRKLVAERAPAEAEIAVGMAGRKRAVEKSYRHALERVTAAADAEQAAVEADFAGVKQTITGQFDDERSAEDRQLQAAREQAQADYETDEATAREAHQESRWQAGAMFEAEKNKLASRMAEIQGQLETQWHEFEDLEHDAYKILRRRLQWRKYAEPEPGPKPEDPLRHFWELLPVAKARLEALVGQGLPRIFQLPWPPIMLALLWGTAAAGCGFLLGWSNYGYWIGLSTGLTLVLGVGLGNLLYDTARTQSRQGYLALRQVLINAEQARQAASDALKTNFDTKVAAMNEQRQAEIKKADEAFRMAMLDLTARRENAIQEAEEKYASAMAEITARRDRKAGEAEAQHQRRAAEVAKRRQEAADRLQRRYQRKLLDIQLRHDEQWTAMAQRWRQGVERFRSSVDDLNRGCRQMVLDWNSSEWSNWTTPAQIPAAIPIARCDVSLKQVEGGLPGDERLRPEQTEFSMPATFPARGRSLVLFKSSGEGLARSVEAIQAVMLRLLTAIPPGKVRFMIIDPVGLGENFSAFMHLADYNDALVSNRIWTDNSHIEQRLAELTGHMENVIQVYLRNEFHSIDEYNQFAGDLAEPYRVLVVANFPSGFSETAAARLSSIVASGARCGVYTVLSVDTRMRMPRDFHLADLETHAMTLSWNDGAFHWDNSELGPLPIAFDRPPEAEKFTDIVCTVGHAAKDADRVEVPFSCVAPPDGQWWTGDAASGIDVPLGRAGAMKLQSLRLGKGTSQHVLIAGKTGSGKSTLLHALVTNIALRYSPDEVELFLIDFKKGVEFKAYAHTELPHARVIAIESEREFGLSVLERLDQELRVRGDLFRACGVQDLPGFRGARPDVRLPRMLLIVDEFQELFTEDDRLAQNASLLLDRLVRQGRAFGIHVLLGSQTLAGSYSLPRSTIGQMAVRIALQCSESDAHLILSEENTAARLLKRPGEAIYNDANGLFEGNHPFQVVWLSDDQREAQLQRVQQFARQRNYVSRPPIVFEGNVPADPSKNDLLAEALSAREWPPKSPVVRAWLGSAVAIKDPTAAEFQRQSGNNLLLVGHQDEAALGVLSTCLVSLAAQHAPCPPGDGTAAGTRFYVLDGARTDSPGAGFWPRMPGIVPHPVKVFPVRGAGQAMAELTDELARREQSGVEDDPPVYVIVYDLARLRDLRRSDDDYSFSRRDDERPSPAAQFAKLLREGPALGIHMLIWCDTYSNVGRSLDRSGLREIELRVLFQMNAADSANLIDSPVAAQLGVHRALFYNEAEGRLEKFRPYGPPSDEWLARVREQLCSRCGQAG